MGLFGFGKKKDLPFKFLVPYFEEICEALIEFNISDYIDDDSRCGLVEIFTSASALVSASYHVKFYIACGGKIDKKTNQELAGIIIPFFDFINDLTIKTAEKETGKKYNKENWFDNVGRIQEEKFRKYAEAILKTYNKGRSSAGVDITYAVTEDCFKKEIFDMRLAAKLLTTTYSVSVG